MSIISLRLSSQLEAQLDSVTKQAKTSRSELVRQAIESYLAHLEQQQALEKMIQQSQNLSPEARQEMQNIEQLLDESVTYEDEGVWWK